MTSGSTSEAFFDAKYQANRDPWNFSASQYELGRYSVILEALQGRHYTHAFEPGCSIGVLTEQLAPFCGRLDAMDISATAAACAAQRCAGFPHVHVRHGSLPADLPPGAFDLVVFSEIGYYFDQAALQALLGILVSRLVSQGILLAVHWLGYSPDHILSGDQVHAMIGELNLTCSLSQRHSGFRLDRWVKA